MKKIIAIVVFGLMTVTSMVVMAGCKSANKEICRIHGTMESSRWDGKEIQKQLRDYNMEFTKRMTPGVFKDFLQKMYPSVK